jgi:hypothetical protein
MEEDRIRVSVVDKLIYIVVSLQSLRLSSFGHWRKRGWWCSYSEIDVCQCGE